MRGRANWFDVAWVACWGVFGSALIVCASSRVGATFDEPFYLRSGLEHWRTGSTFVLMRAGTMPLPVDVQTAPLRATELIRGSQWDLEAEFDRAATIGRYGTLVFWWMTLLYGGLIARQLGGSWASRLAVAVLAMEPNLLAHAGLATTDVAVTGCLLMFAFHYRNGRERGWALRIGLPAFCCGLTILAKASGLVFAPICVLVIEADRLWRRSAADGVRPRAVEVFRGLVARPFLREFAATGSLALLFVYIYCGCDWQTHPQFIADARALPDSPLKNPAVWATEHLAIFNNAGVGLWYQIQHNLRGHGAYLMGEACPRAVWYYFPVALSMKLPLPLLAAPLLLALFSRRSLANWPCLASFVLIAFSLNCRVQIGVRMQLPLIAFAIVGLSAATAKALSTLSQPIRRFAVVVSAASIGWIGISAIRYWPNDLCYFNELWRGSYHGEQLLSDSNLDWGQGLKELDDWRRGRALSDVSIWYFGTDPAAAKSPFRVAALHTFDIHDEQDLITRVPGRYLAVGTTILYGSYVSQPDWLLARLRATRPADRTNTFLIFDINELVSPSGAPAAVAARPPKPASADQ